MSTVKKISDSFDALVLLTSIPSEKPILWKYSIYNIPTFNIIFCLIKCY